MANTGEGFRFGIEAEYLLADASTMRPLRYGELQFEVLNDLLESIPVEDLPSVEGLLPQPPHRRVMPYVVEGYHLPDPEAPNPTLLPKGLEIRTPVCQSIEEAVSVAGELLERLQQSLQHRGWTAIALSHHPEEERFAGPQGGRSERGWRWAQQAMLTFGPDVNVSLPLRWRHRIEKTDLIAKVNYYAPAMTLLTLGAPLEQGTLWTHAGRVGKSVRTFRRSSVGDAVEFHPEQPGRLEFKCFEMTPRITDFQAYLALWLAVLLDERMAGRTDEQSRVQDLQTASVAGLTNDALRERAEELLDLAADALARWDFDPQLLAPFVARLRSGRLPADDIVEWYQATNSIPAVLGRLAASAEVFS